MSFSNQLSETITAIATPIGTGGVGIIRLSGNSAFEITAEVFSAPIKVGKINHGWIFDDTKKIDEVIVLAFKAPNSYTGENVIEIQCHGGIQILKTILAITIKKGA